MRSKRQFLQVLIVAMVLVFDLAQASPLQQGLRFNSAGVLNLAKRLLKHHGSTQLPIGLLAAVSANDILAAPDLGQERATLTFSDAMFACKDQSARCLIEHERKLISATAGVVKRDGKRLAIAVDTGAPVVFIDWKMPESKNADGDEEAHWYLGRMPGNGYQRVEVQFGHDAPGSFLINPRNGKTAFVHNGADIVAPSPDGMHVVTFNTLNPPISIRVAALDATGPRLELQCEGGKGADQAQILFKGWHDVRSFDLVVLPRGEAGKEMLPLRVAQNPHGWSLATSDIKGIAATGFSCR